MDEFSKVSFELILKLNNLLYATMWLESTLAKQNTVLVTTETVSS